MSIKMRRLFTVKDMSKVFTNGFVLGWTKAIPITDNQALNDVFVKWLDENYPEGCEATLRAEEI